MPQLGCTLIISTFNWPGALDLCLRSVLNQTILPNQIVIADDGSGVDTAHLIQHFQSIFTVPLTLVWHKDEGFRKTLILNKAIHQSLFDYIIQIDGDVILDRNFIADHLQVAEKGTFIRGTRGMLTQKKTQEILKHKNIEFNAFSSGISHRFNALRIPFLRHVFIKRQRSSDQVRGSNFAFWKSDFIKVNGYNNSISGWGHEDEELAARLINLGLMKKVVKLSAVQYHLYHSGTHRNSALKQRELINKIKADNIIYCNNGYIEADE